MMKFCKYLLSVLVSILLTPCAAQKQHGKASYYSKKATGARTASGQRLHHDSLTCAHKHYPFGTMLKVTNLSNSKSVIVKVIDRGPFGRGRIIDLSWGAAKAIGMLSQGVASVRVERLDKPIPYRPEEEKLPKIEFDVAESDYEYTPKWRKKSDEKYPNNELQTTKDSKYVHKNAITKEHYERHKDMEHKDNKNPKENKNHKEDLSHKERQNLRNNHTHKESMPHKENRNESAK